MARLSTDEALLAATPTEPHAFGVFYERHETTVLTYFQRRVGDVELAADLTAETFAQALVSSPRFRPGPAPAVAWLLGIARNVLAMSRRQGRVEASARARLQMEPIELDDRAMKQLEDAISGSVITDLLAALPADQRLAVEARVLEDGEYSEIARGLHCSEQVVRKKVSRGLSTLKTRYEASV
jgi:RNA polymerase sigma-70 factor (ECF subfamily)